MSAVMNVPIIRNLPLLITSSYVKRNDLTDRRYITIETKISVPDPSLKSKPKRLECIDTEKSVEIIMESVTARIPISIIPFGTRSLPFQTSLISSIVIIIRAKKDSAKPIEYSVRSQGSGSIEIGMNIREA